MECEFTIFLGGSQPYIARVDDLFEGHPEH